MQKVFTAFVLDTPTCPPNDQTMHYVGGRAVATCTTLEGAKTLVEDYCPQSGAKVQWEKDQFAGIHYLRQKDAKVYFGRVVEAEFVIVQ